MRNQIPNDNIASGTSEKSIYKGGINIIIYIGVGMWLLFTILCLVIYHKFFNIVIYFDFGAAFWTEIASAAMIGGILLFLTICFWWLVDIIIAIAAIILIVKSDSNGVRIFTGICALALGFAIFYLATNVTGAWF